MHPANFASQPLSRRRFLATTSMAASAFAVNPRGLFAQTATSDFIAQARAAGAKAEIVTQPLRSSVTVLSGSGGNIAVLTGLDGKLVVDSGYATSQPQLANALGVLSSSPIKHLINTHWHFDHTDGNNWMHSTGAMILAHDNTKLRLSTPQTMAAFHVTLPPSPPGAIPTKTFADAKTLYVNRTTLHLSHYLPAHTDSDIAILFTEPDILHVGDTWFNGFYPFIDYSSGGSIDGMIHAANHNLFISTKETMIIPGHGPIGNRAQLAEYRDVLVFAREQVATLKKQGRTVEETIAAKPTAKYDAKWGGGFMNPATFVGLVYQGV